jgi:hypothetical protein
LLSKLGKQADPAGYSLIELLVAMGIGLSLTAGTMTLVARLQVGFGPEGERADGQQRLRVAFDAIARDLSRAGTGPYLGRPVAPLGLSVATVLPFRQGAERADPPGTFRSDTITIVYVPAAGGAQATVQEAVHAGAGTSPVALERACPGRASGCGFAAGMDVITYDDTGAYDTFRVVSTIPGVLQLQHSMAATAQIYLPGATMVEAISHTYYLKADAADTFQLMRYDGVASTAAVADHVVGLAFEYFGDPLPPQLIAPVTDPVGPWTTYGPKPPPPDVQATAYPAGENCAFQLDANGRVIPRLEPLGGGPTLVELTAAQLSDGPWCPDVLNQHRYDADLLRIRRISVTLRIEAGTSSLRGPAGLLFARSGTSRDPSHWVPDREIRFDIAPRNLNVSR